VGGGGGGSWGFAGPGWMFAAEEGGGVFLFPGGRSVWLGWLGLLVSGVFFLKRFRGGGDGKGGGGLRG